MSSDGLVRRRTQAFGVADDLQVHVSVLTVEKDKFLEIRNFVISTGMYGRGILIPYERASDLQAALQKVILPR